MSRLLKRVPLDFSWPLRVTWKGYLCPYQSQKCIPCDGTGLSPAAKQIADDWYDFADTGRRWCDQITQDEVDALIAQHRLHQFRDHPGPITAKMVNSAERQHHLHDAINRWICVDTRLKRLGLFETRRCVTCGGDGSIWFSEKVKQLADHWYEDERYDPPTGDGYQLWENVSEGSPVSPVFPTLEALCEWCAVNATTFGSSKASKEQWMEMLSPGKMVHHQEGQSIFL